MEVEKVSSAQTTLSFLLRQSRKVIQPVGRCTLVHMPYTCKDKTTTYNVEKITSIA